jgi:hypothetical protein
LIRVEYLGGIPDDEIFLAGFVELVKGSEIRIRILLEV